MEFPNESLPILASTISNCAKSLFNTLNYVYAISDKDFYNINVKDIFKVALQDVTVTDNMLNLNIPINSENTKELNAPDYKHITKLIAFQFAARLPLLKKTISDFPIKDKQLKALYDIIISSGEGDNYGGVILETFEENMKIAKSKQAAPPFTSEWLRRYVYTYLPELGSINNRNLYFLGCAEALFPLYNTALENKLSKMIYLLQKN